jgi:hypothetical protein
MMGSSAENIFKNSIVNEGKQERIVSLGHSIKQAKEYLTFT